MCSATLSGLDAVRGTSSVLPTLTSMRSGIWFTSRSRASLMPTALAASAGFSVRGATQAVQLESGRRNKSSSRTKRLAAS